jgi:hypothetical protein
MRLRTILFISAILLMTGFAFGQVTATLTGPATICNGASPSFTVTVVNPGASTTYAWVINGNTQTATAVTLPSPYNTVPYSYTLANNLLSNGASIRCSVLVGGTSYLSNAYTVNFTTTTPTVSIGGVTKLAYCSGETINFTATSSYATAASNYIWKLYKSGGILETQFPSSKSNLFPLVVGANIASPNTFSPGDVLTVDVTDLSGTCLSPTTATKSLSSSIITINDYPTAVINEAIPSGTLKIFSTATQSLSTPLGYSYQWKKDGAAITPGGTANTYTTNLAGIYTVVVTSASCSTTSSPLQIIKNSMPVANAGLDKTIGLPTRDVVLTGSGTDTDGTIAAYAWRYVSGPATPTLSGASTATLSVSNLAGGSYVFALKVTDDTGEASAEAPVTVSVTYPANNYNWIKETIVLTKNKLTEADVTASQVQNGEKSVNWKYFDGLGRPMQSVAVQASPTQKDVVQTMLYDALGRENKKYLPVVTNTIDGGYKPNLIDATTGSYINQALNFYNNTTDKIADDIRPFAETIFEPSPLNRPDKEFGAGADWNTKNKSVQHQYLVNINGTAAAQEQVIVWKLDATGLPIRETAVNTAVSGGCYTTGQLSIKSTKDEQGNEVREYADKQGRTILKKVQAVASPVLGTAAHWAQTYYIYDDLGNLVMVLPPEAVNKLAP